MQNLLKRLSKIPISPQTYKALPESAGVYVFFRDAYPIYIGKAINLKRRVSSYFDLNLFGKTANMVSDAEELSYIQVTSELEALLLEARLIRKYMPKYNIAAKDDKHPLYIQITKDKYPRVITVRKIDLNKNKAIANYGPFPSSGNVHSVLKMLRRIFPYSDHKLGARPCLYSHLGLCNPCPNLIEITTEVTLQANLRKKYLNNVRHVKSILDGKLNIVMKNLEKEMELLSEHEDYEAAVEVRNKIARLEYITQPQMPTEFYIQNPNLYEDVRKNELEDLKKILNRGYSTWKVESLHRIECFDVAHLAGTNATASMVTFIDGVADKTFYRHFRIRQTKGNSDIDSMKEVARRRSNHFEDWGAPDLVIVDGSTSQVNAFVPLLRYNGTAIPVVGIAKHPDRLIIGDKKINLQGATLQFVSRIRDEAHRFARVYHHKLVSKSLLNQEG